MFGSVDLTSNISKIRQEKVTVGTNITRSESLWLLPIVVTDWTIISSKWWPNTSWTTQRVKVSLLSTMTVSGTIASGAEVGATLETVVASLDASLVSAVFTFVASSFLAILLAVGCAVWLLSFCD